MGLGAILPNILPDLISGQKPDDMGPSRKVINRAVRVE
jgi:hypothetical protein